MQWPPHPAAIRCSSSLCKYSSRLLYGNSEGVLYLLSCASSSNTCCKRTCKDLWEHIGKSLFWLWHKPQVVLAPIFLLFTIYLKDLLSCMMTSANIFYQSQWSFFIQIGNSSKRSIPIERSFEAQAHAFFLEFGYHTSNTRISASSITGI